MDKPKKNAAEQAAAMTDAQLAHIQEKVAGELARRGVQTGPDPAFMTPGEFEKFKNEMVAAGDRAKRAAERAAAAAKDGDTNG